MFKKLVFFNWYGNGDLFNSREFVKELMKKIEAEEYYYAHGKSPRMFEDIPELRYMRIDENCGNAKHFRIVENSLYINTWIGLNPKYVLPGIGCTINKNIELYNDIMKAARLRVSINSTYLKYIPRIDFDGINSENLDRVDSFLYKYKDRTIVLWSNGRVNSMQAENFDFNPVIDRIVDEFPDIIFVVTSRDYQNNSDKNLKYSDDIIQADDGFDLNEISYLSLHCKVIIGRASGPSTFAQEYRNMINANKKHLVFSKNPSVAYFAYPEPVPAKVYWNNSTDFEGVYNGIKEVLRDV